MVTLGLVDLCNDGNEAERSQFMSRDFYWGLTKQKSKLVEQAAEKSKSINGTMYQWTNQVAARGVIIWQGAGIGHINGKPINK